jgi:tRNA A37 threonylcarbamoyladenosine synthetase subunit TsaC/SUA5/YrdC
MTDMSRDQSDEDFDYGCECGMALLNEPTEDRLNDLIDELDEDGMIPTEVVYGLLATILMSLNEEDHEGDEH